MVGTRCNKKTPNLVHTLVPEMKRKSSGREGSKNAILFSFLSYAATCRNLENDITNLGLTEEKNALTKHYRYKSIDTNRITPKSSL
jgi:hypothetical protein